MCFIFLISSCAKTPIQKYLETNKYEAFTIPRDDWGAGTIINYNAGSEEIVALNKNCLKMIPDSSAVVLSSYSYTLTRSNTVELSLAKVLNEQLDLKGAFNNARVKKVNIQLIKAKEKVLPVITVKERIKNIDNEGNVMCLNEILSNKNVIIMRTLSVDSLVYTFLDDNNTSITMDANFLKNINANTTIKSAFEGKTELRIQKTTYIGYRAREFTSGSGLLEGKIDAKEELSPTEIEKRKKNK